MDMDVDMDMDMETESQNFTANDIILFETIANSQANAHPVEVDGIRLFNLSSIDVCAYYMQIPVPTFEGNERDRKARLRATHCSHVSGAPVCEDGTKCASCFKTYKDCPGHMTYVQASKVFIVPIHYDFMCTVLNNIVTLQLWDNEAPGTARSVTHPYDGGRASPIDSIGHSRASKNKTLRYYRARAGGNSVAINACLAKRGAGGQHVPSPFTSFYAIFSIVCHYRKVRAMLGTLANDDPRREQLDAYASRLEASISHVVPMLPYPRRLEKNKDDDSRAFSPVNDLYDKVFDHSSSMLSDYPILADGNMCAGEGAQMDEAERVRETYFRKYLGALLEGAPVILAKDSAEAIARQKDFLSKFTQYITHYAVDMLQTHRSTINIMIHLVDALKELVSEYRIHLHGMNKTSIADLVRAMSKSKVFDDASFDLSSLYYNVALGQSPAAGGHAARGRPNVAKQASLINSLKGKEGIFRETVISKRQSGMFGRAVITPAAGLQCTHVTAPKRWRDTITLSFIIKSSDVDKALELLNRNCIVKIERDMMMYEVEARPCNTLNCGTCMKCVEAEIRKMRDIPNAFLHVRRRLMEEDFVIVNRQPTLSFRSMQSMRISTSYGPSDANTMYLPPQVAPPFNADYDGDEMNQFVPDQQMARAEARFLMSNEQNWWDIVCFVQDMIHGMFLCARDHTRFNQITFNRLSAQLVALGLDVDELAAIRPTPEKLFTGFDVIRLVMRCAPNLPFTCESIFDGFPDGRRSPAIRPLMTSQELFLIHGTDEMWGPNTPAALREEAPWSPGRVSPSAHLVAFTVIDLKPGETSIEVQGESLVRTSDRSTAILALRSCSLNGIQIIVKGAGAKRLIEANRDNIAIIDRSHGGPVTVDGSRPIAANRPFDMALIKRQGMCPFYRMSSALAGEPVEFTPVLSSPGEKKRRLRLSMALFPVNKKALNKNMIEALQMVENAEAVRLLDAISRIGSILCDVLGSSVSLHDLMVQTRSMEEKKREVLRDVEERTRTIVRELGPHAAAPWHDASAYSKHVMSEEDAYTAATSELITYIHANVDRPMEGCGWTGVRMFTCGSKSKGDKGKMREMAVMAGIRDINSSLPYGRYDRCTLYAPSVGESGGWLARNNGLITSSYVDGVGPQDAWFEQQTSTVNIAGSKLLIKDAGYDGRKSSYSLSDVLVNYDMCVEDARKVITFWSPLVHPDRMRRVDLGFIEKMNDIPPCPPGEELTMQHIRIDLETILAPNGTHMVNDICDKMARNATADTDAKLTTLYRRIRKHISEIRLYPGTTLGLIISAHINNKCAQDALDTFHQTTGSSANRRTREVLEQPSVKVEDMGLIDDFRDGFSFVKLKTSTNTISFASVRVPSDGARSAFAALQGCTVADVAVSIEVMYHAWLAERKVPSDPIDSVVSERLRRAILAAKALHDSHAVEAPDICMPIFRTALHVELTPDLTHEESIAVFKAFSKRTAKDARRRAFWSPSENGQGSMIHLCVMRDTPPRRGTKRKVDAEPAQSIAGSDSESELEYESSDADEEEDDGFEAQELQNEFFPDPAEPAAREASLGGSSDEEREVESEGEESEEESEVESEEEEEEEEDEDEEGQGRRRGRARGAAQRRKPPTTPRSKYTEEEVYRLFLGFAFFNNKEDVFDGLHDRMTETDRRLDRWSVEKKSKDKSASVDKGLLDNKFLNTITWRGVRMGTDRIRYDASEERLAVPNTRMEWIISRATRDMALDTIRSMNHNNNLSILGIEAATRIMRADLTAMWPDMPKFYIFVLCEYLSFNGRILQMNHGGVISEKGVMAKMLFEKAKQVIVKQAGSMEDGLFSQASRTCVGSTAMIGTGLPRIYAPV